MAVLHRFDKPFCQFESAIMHFHQQMSALLD